MQIIEYQKYTFEILVVNATVVILAAVITDRRTSQIFSVCVDFCSKDQRYISSESDLQLPLPGLVKKKTIRNFGLSTKPTMSHYLTRYFPNIIVDFKRI